MLWTGKQVYQYLFRGKSVFNISLNLELKANNFTPVQNGQDNCLCPRDGYVIIKNNELLCGNLCKKTLGSSKKGLVFVVLRDFGSEQVKIFLTRLTKLTSRFLMNWGFSIGLDDVTPTEELDTLKKNIIKQNYNGCTEKIKQYINN